MSLHQQTNIYYTDLFYLREQLHSYLDVFELHQSRLLSYIPFSLASEIIEEKLGLITALDFVLWETLPSRISNSSKFNPLRIYWLNHDQVHQCTSAYEIMELLISVELKIMNCCSESLISKNSEDNSIQVLIGILKLAYERSKKLAEVLK